MLLFHKVTSLYKQVTVKFTLNCLKQIPYVSWEGSQNFGHISLQHLEKRVEASSTTAQIFSS